MRCCPSSHLESQVCGRPSRAIVTKGGEVRLHGNVARTPSAAAKFIVRRPCNGWSFWLYEAEPGTWVKLTGLRRAAD